MPTWTIEITPPRAANPLWPPTKDQLRGRLDYDTLPHGTQRDMDRNLEGFFYQLSSAGHHRAVPGMLVSIDIDAQKAHITDPLANQTEVAKLILKHAPALAKIPNRIEACEPREFDLSTRPDMLASWLYWMIRFEREGYATTHSGRKPSKKPEELGRVMHNPWYIGAHEAKYLDEKDKPRTLTLADV